jgi:Ser-tRNA(Ala) deacylase AlaX
MREFDSRVTFIDRDEVVLDQTCFFASSGGQPSDTGLIGGVRVLDVKRGANKDIVHVLETEKDVKVGQILNGRIDWDRRYKIMRLHSACHVMSGVLQKSFNVRKHTGIQIHEDKARMDFDMEKLDQAIVQAIENEANRIVESHHDITARVLTWEEVNRDPDLKTVSEDRYEKFDVPRLIDIVGFDTQLDGGTHVLNTREIGKIKIVRRENKGKNNKRITLVVENR